MMYLTLFLAYLVFCGIVALWDLMENFGRSNSSSSWIQNIATPGLLFFVAAITAVVWITGKLRGK